VGNKKPKSFLHYGRKKKTRLEGLALSWECQEGRRGSKQAHLSRKKVYFSGRRGRKCNAKATLRGKKGEKIEVEKGEDEAAAQRWGGAAVEPFPSSSGAGSWDKDEKRLERNRNSESYAQYRIRSTEGVKGTKWEESDLSNFQTMRGREYDSDCCGNMRKLSWRDADDAASTLGTAMDGRTGHTYARSESGGRRGNGIR